MFNFLAQTSTYGGQVTTLSGLNTPLGQIIGLLVKIAFLAGVVMITHGATMDRSNGEYKHVLIRAAIVMGAATFVGILFVIFFPGQNPITALFQ
jgi:hypothetical protein